MAPKSGGHSIAAQVSRNCHLLSSVRVQDESMTEKYALGWSKLSHKSYTLRKPLACSSLRFALKWKVPTMVVRSLSTAQSSSLLTHWETLSEAVEAGGIKKLGALRPLDENDCVINDASWQKVHQSGSQWAEAIEAALSAYQKVFGDQLISVHVRGSVPRGLAVAGLSDLDMVAHVFQQARDFESHYASEQDTDWSHSLQHFKAEIKQRFPFLAGVEMRVFFVELASDFASTIRSHLAQDRTSSEFRFVGRRPEEIDNQLSSRTASHSRWLGKESVSKEKKDLLPLNFPGAFLLKAESLRVWGADLQTRLPPEAALPKPRARPTLRESVKRAIAYGRLHREEGECDRAGAIYKWALKRCIRAGFEATIAETGDKVYTRDLYWCCHVAAQQRPELEPTLVRALRLCLQSSAEVGKSSREVENSLQILGTAFSAPSEITARNEPFHTQSPQETLGQLFQSASRQQGSQRPRAVKFEHTAQKTKPVRLPTAVWKLALILLRRGNLEKSCVASPLPLFKGAIKGPVTAFDWGNEAERQAAVHALHLILSGSTEAKPVVLRGAGSSHPAVKRWTLDYLASSSDLEGLVRVSPEMNFTYCEESHPDVRSGHVAAPSRTVRMSVQEFALRSQQELPAWLRPLHEHYYWKNERYYMQASLTSALLQDLSLDQLPFAVAEDAVSTRIDSLKPRSSSSSESSEVRKPLVEHAYKKQSAGVGAHPSKGPDVGADFSGAEHADVSRWEVSQEPRLWMSPAGAVSPLHFDVSPSCLLQVHGRKRMLLYESGDLPSLYPFPDDHPMRRRAQVDPTAPDLVTFPAFADVAASEAVLEPGDVIFFPSRWAHYTESVDFSLSVTCRFVEKRSGST